MWPVWPARIECRSNFATAGETNSADLERRFGGSLRAFLQFLAPAAGIDAISTLEAYLIIDHRRRRVERHARDARSGEWRREEIVGDGRVRVPCLDVDLTLDEIYERVELPSVGEPERVGYKVR